MTLFNLHTTQIFNVPPDTLEVELHLKLHCNDILVSLQKKIKKLSINLIPQIMV